MPAGRPRAFKTVEQLQKGIDAYIETEQDAGDPITVSGLAASLGVDRKTLFRYADGEYDEPGGPQFCPTIKRAIGFIEADKLKHALKGEYNTAVAIFDLKNNHDWKDTQHIEKKGKNETTIAFDEKSAKLVSEGVAELIRSAF
jgi:hypothetical protein